MKTHKNMADSKLVGSFTKPSVYARPRSPFNSFHN